MVLKFKSLIETHDWLNTCDECKKFFVCRNDLKLILNVVQIVLSFALSLFDIRTLIFSKLLLSSVFEYYKFNKYDGIVKLKLATIV